ncbi:hypothetical protein RFI_02832, partial [Reticulomyxa filosa]
EEEEKGNNRSDNHANCNGNSNGNNKGKSELFEIAQKKSPFLAPDLPGDDNAESSDWDTSDNDTATVTIETPKRKDTTPQPPSANGTTAKRGSHDWSNATEDKTQKTESNTLTTETTETTMTMTTTTTVSKGSTNCNVSSVSTGSGISNGSNASKNPFVEWTPGVRPSDVRSRGSFVIYDAKKEEKKNEKVNGITNKSVYPFPRSEVEIVTRTRQTSVADLVTNYSKIANLSSSFKQSTTSNSNVLARTLSGDELSESSPKVTSRANVPIVIPDSNSSGVPVETAIDPTESDEENDAKKLRSKSMEELLNDVIADKVTVEKTLPSALFNTVTLSGATVAVTAATTDVIAPLPLSDTDTGSFVITTNHNSLTVEPLLLPPSAVTPLTTTTTTTTTTATSATTTITTATSSTIATTATSSSSSSPDRQVQSSNTTNIRPPLREKEKPTATTTTNSNGTAKSNRPTPKNENANNGNDSKTNKNATKGTTTGNGSNDNSRKTQTKTEPSKKTSTTTTTTTATKANKKEVTLDKKPSNESVQLTNNNSNAMAKKPKKEPVVKQIKQQQPLANKPSNPTPNNHTNTPNGTTTNGAQNTTKTNPTVSMTSEKNKNTQVPLQRKNVLTAHHPSHSEASVATGSSVKSTPRNEDAKKSTTADPKKLNGNSKSNNKNNGNKNSTATNPMPSPTLAPAKTKNEPTQTNNTSRIQKRISTTSKDNNTQNHTRTHTHNHVHTLSNQPIATAPKAQVRNKQSGHKHSQSTMNGAIQHKQAKASTSDALTKKNTESNNTQTQNLSETVSSLHKSAASTGNVSTITNTSDLSDRSKVLSTTSNGNSNKKQKLTTE